MWQISLLPYLLKLASWIPGSLPQIVQWSIPYVLFNFCTLSSESPCMMMKKGFQKCSLSLIFKVFLYCISTGSFLLENSAVDYHIYFYVLPVLYCGKVCSTLRENYIFMRLNKRSVRCTIISVEDIGLCFYILLVTSFICPLNSKIDKNLHIWLLQDKRFHYTRLSNQRPADRHASTDCYPLYRVPIKLLLEPGFPCNCMFLYKLFTLFKTLQIFVLCLNPYSAKR